MIQYNAAPTYWRTCRSAKTTRPSTPCAGGAPHPLRLSPRPSSTADRVSFCRPRCCGAKRMHCSDSARTAASNGVDGPDYTGPNLQHARASGLCATLHGTDCIIVTTQSARQRTNELTGAVDERTSGAWELVSCHEAYWASLRGGGEVSRANMSARYASIGIETAAVRRAARCARPSR